MIRVYIKERFIQLSVDFSGVIKKVESGEFCLNQLQLEDSIFKICPFLEHIIGSIPTNKPLHLKNKLIKIAAGEFSVDLEIIKNPESIAVLIINRTNAYQYANELDKNINNIATAKEQLEDRNKRLESLLKSANETIENKSELLAITSHEIRNQINSILNYGHFIFSSANEPKIKDYSSSIIRAGKNLKVIVNDILELSRFENKAFDLVNNCISIQEIATNCVNDFKFQLESNNLKLYLQLSDDLPKYVIGDAVRLNQILINIIGNSLKFTQKGFVKIIIDVISEEENSAFVGIKVQDTGRGMSTDQVKNIFSAFEQTETDDHRILGGAGLGLYITKRLVNAMKGKISVSSVINEGTEFALQIPFQKTKKLKINGQSSLNNTGKKVNLKGLKLLLADDDELNHLIAQHLLKDEEVDLTIVKDGLEALTALKTESYDIALLDIYMPNLTGENLIKEKELFLKKNTNIPMLALTANANEDDKERYLSLGFDSVITKPYSINSLKTSIEEAFSEYSK